MIKERKDGKLIITLEKEDELYEVKPGLYLIITNKEEGKGIKTSKENEKLNEKIDDKKEQLLMKLYNMRYQDRALKSLKLSEDEKNILNELIKEGKVFLATKSKEPHVAISKKVFTELSSRKKQVNEQILKKERIKENKKEAFFDVNFAITDDSGAKAIIESNPALYIAVKHFDKKVYVVKKSFYDSVAKQIRKILKDAMHYGEIASLLNIEPAAALAVLRNMAERGEVYEEKKDFFKLLS
jgi:TRAP-type C4-dicarboxylate transport system substrate-binding protein